MNKCPICNTVNEDSAIFCTGCGQQLRIIEIKQTTNYSAIKRKNKKSNLQRVLIAVISSLIGFLLIYSAINIRQQVVEITHQIKVGGNLDLDKYNLADGLQIDPGAANGTYPENEMDYIVDASMVQFKFDVSSKKKWIWFNVTKDGSEKDYIIPINEGQVDTRVYLPFNAGDYVVTIYTSTLDQASGTYYLHKKYNVRNIDTRDLTFLLPDTYVESDSEEIIQLANQIVEGLQTDYEKTLAIHDWICNNIAYDTEAYFSNNIKEYSALDTVKGGKAICNGYANLTAALNRAVGIRTKIVGGTAWLSWDKNKTESHAWNEVLIDGRWVIQDTTWDAGFVDYNNNQFIQRMTHDYFDINEQSFSQSHSKNDER